jgi:hypothetical protein
MKSTMKTLLALVVLLSAATGAWAQAAGNWQHIHGQVQAVQGNQLTVKTDDGRVLNVDMSQVSRSVQGAMTPNLGVTVTGFPGASPDRFTARYITQDHAGPAAGTVVNRVLPLVPQFSGSKEFQDRAAGFQNNRAAAEVFVTQLYRGFFEREPGEQERSSWVAHVLQSGDVKGIVEMFLKSPEYVGKNKSEPQAIADLYQAFFGRTPSNEEIRTWQQRIVQR